MKLFAIRTATTIALAVAAAGCQSGPRWAWWNNKKASEDTSLVARSADPPASATASTGAKTAPALPSTQATPQAAVLAAAPPSSMNLANAANPGAALNTTAVGTTPASTLPASSAATIAAAPLAAYPTATTPAATAAPATALAGPYNPHAYQDAGSVATAAPVTNAAGGNPSIERVASAAPNRYGMPPETTPAATAAAPTAAPAGDRYGVLANTYSSMPPVTVSSSTIGGQATPAGDRYGLPGSDRYTASIAASEAPATTATSAALPSAVAALPAATQPATEPAPTTVQLSTAPGHYRPGSTSTYVAAPSMAAIEIASRPAAPTATEPAPPSAPTATTPTQDSWPAVPPLPSNSGAPMTGGSISVGSRY